MPSASSAAHAVRRSEPVARRLAVGGLAVLTLINLLNYLDRYVVSALVPDLERAHMGLTDLRAGALMTGFLVVYMLTAPVFGILGDRVSRTRTMAVGVLIWSVATGLSGFARNYLQLLGGRAIVGIGEAAYGTIAPALLADYFPLKSRGRVFAVFYMAIPVGSALGYIVGGLFDHWYGWQAAFFVAGVPGLVLAIWSLRLPDPPRGIQDEGGLESESAAGAPVRGAAPSGAAPSGGAPSGGAPSGGAPSDAAPSGAAPSGAAESSSAAAGAASSGAAASMLVYWRLLKRLPYLLTVLGYAAYTFAVGGLAFWMPTFLERVRGVPGAQATTGFGVIVVVTGFAGTFAGGWLGDYWLRFSREAYLWLSALTALLAVPLSAVALVAQEPALYYSAIVAAELLLFMSTGPLNSQIVNLVAPQERASAVALSVLVIHLLGDVVSPPLIGAISDRASLAAAVLIVPAAIAVCAALWWAAGRAARRVG